MGDQESIRVGCPNCQARLRVMPRAAGKRLRCPKCGMAVTAPSMGRTPEEEPDVPPRDYWPWYAGGIIVLLFAVGLGFWVLNGDKQQSDPDQASVAASAKEPRQVSKPPVTPSAKEPGKVKEQKDRRGELRQFAEHPDPLDVHPLAQELKERTTFKLRGGTVYSVSFSPDGKKLAAGDHDGIVTLWDITTSKELHSLKGHDVQVRSVAFSPDGKTLASCGYDKSGQQTSEVKLWDVTTGKGLRTFKLKTWVTCVAYSRDGKTLAWAEGTEIKLWDINAEKEKSTLEGHGNQIRSLAFTADGKTFVSGGGNFMNDGEILFWDAATWKQRAKLSKGVGSVGAIALTSDGKLLAVGSAGIDDKARIRPGEIRLLGISDGEYHFVLKGHTFFVNSVAFTRDGKIIASGSPSDSVKLWNTSTGKQFATVNERSNGAWTVAFSPDGKILASGSDNGTVVLWNVIAGKDVRK